jgi:class 3 adenylate cyclase
MEPRIQYAQTEDGVSIAFWTLGEGTPLVHMPWIPYSHIQLEWQIPEWHGWHEQLAKNRKLVRYDGRGSGLSDRDVRDYSLDRHLHDLEAVVHRLGLDSFALFAPLHSGPVAITYASRHPERISHLILWCSYARASDYLRSTQAQTMRSLALGTASWELYTETVAHGLMGWSAGEPARRLAALLRESVTQEAAQAAISATGEFDVASSLAKVRSPTLVLHRRQVAFPAVDTGRGLASRIPDARLVLLEGTSMSPYLEDTETALQAIDDFLGEGEEAAPKLSPSGMVTILFTDMEGSTTLTERLGDAKAQELRRTHDSIVREALKAQGGSETKHTGDGIMASFPSASRAIECAVAVQRAIAEGETQLRVRIGLNAGEPVAEESDLFGTAVNLAKRICDQAEPGQILVSDVVQQLAAGKGFTFADKGEATLKGFEKPVRLHEVVWD